jgi:hypothetical protein
MTPDELRARERFYGSMLWIVNGAPFAESIFVLGRLPKPEALWAMDIVFQRQNHKQHGGIFWRHSENPDHDGTSLVQCHSLSTIQNDIDRDYVGHHFIDWVRPRSVWLESAKNVYIDLGGDLLWQLLRYDRRGLLCARAVRKQTLVSEHGGTYAETGRIERGARRRVRSGDVVDRGESELLLDRLS